MTASGQTDSAAQADVHIYSMTPATKLFMKGAAIFFIGLLCIPPFLHLAPAPNLIAAITSFALCAVVACGGVWGWMISDRMTTILTNSTISCRYFFALRKLEKSAIAGFRVYPKRYSYEVRIYSKVSDRNPLISFPYTADEYYFNWFSGLKNLGCTPLPPS